MILCTCRIPIQIEHKRHQHLPPILAQLEVHEFSNLPKLVLLEAHGPPSLSSQVQHAALLSCHPYESGTILVFLFWNLNFKFFPMMRRLIFPVPTSMIALASLRNGRPRMRDIPRSPSMSRITKSATMKVSFDLY